MNEIEVIWKFLDNLDEYVYATDIETDELVYMNRKLLEVYGLQSIDDVKGMKCYEVLQKSSVPCGMCNNDRLCAENSRKKRCMIISFRRYGMWS